jgi:hypothetical protein
MKLLTRFVHRYGTARAAAFYLKWSTKAFDIRSYKQPTPLDGSGSCILI